VSVLSPDMNNAKINAKAQGGGGGRGKAADFHPDLDVIRAMSAVLPGPLPLCVNGVRVAASIRPRKFVIEGGDDTAVTMPRTAFQIVYADCSVMIDSGLDKATHDSFSPQKPEPYYAERFAELSRALERARLIVLTHHHADHVAGVICA
jgi:glyoxylase-like metal-dependent hydrolase (beta-lactamase superfamily II)